LDSLSGRTGYTLFKTETVIMINLLNSYSLTSFPAFSKKYFRAVPLLLAVLPMDCALADNLPKLMADSVPKNEIDFKTFVSTYSTLKITN
jgi:hypothetical protein